MPFRCYKCHKMIYNGTPEFHNIFCKDFYRNNNNNNNYNARYNRNNGNDRYSNSNYTYNNRNNSINRYNPHYSRDDRNNRNNSINNRYNPHYYRDGRNNISNRNYIGNHNRYSNNIHINRNRNFDNNRYIVLRINNNNSNSRNRHRNRNLNNILELINNDDLDLDFLFDPHSPLNERHGFNNELSLNLNNDRNDSSEEDDFNDDDDYNNSNGVDESIINSLPKCVIEDVNKLDEKQCIICLEDFKNGEEKTTIPCFHIFHPNCINQWLKANNTCPICKTEIDKEENI